MKIRPDVFLKGRLGPLGRVYTYRRLRRRSSPLLLMVIPGSLAHLSSSGPNVPFGLGCLRSRSCNVPRLCNRSTSESFRRPKENFRLAEACGLYCRKVFFFGHEQRPVPV
jgi:hypothetical protein